MPPSPPVSRQSKDGGTAIVEGGGGGSDAQGSATGGPCKCNCLYYFPTLKTENVLIIPKYYNGLILGNYDGLHSELDKLKREVEEMKKLYKELFESLARKDKDVNAILKKSSAAKIDEVTTSDLLWTGTSSTTEKQIAVNTSSRVKFRGST
uniref:Uncharacterized protein n=1 Tax=Oryza sativa subsp. japonica TaxID=39947 RepID=Q337Q4_ORYSJ|nr:hypothetical protein LOC_Os10g31180 [Oryza sativa Japonica Group]